MTEEGGKRLRELEKANNKLSEEKKKLVKEQANLRDRFNELEAKYSAQKKSQLTSALEQNLNFFKGVVNKIKSVKITKDFWPKLGAVVLGLVAIFEVCLLFKQTKIAKNQTDLMGEQNSMAQNQTALMDSQTNIMKFQNQMFGEQNKMVEKQTSMIDWQNRLFENQNTMVQHQTDLMDEQTKMIAQQNLLFQNQNLLVEAQNNRLDQQTYLQEAERRSALVFLMGNIFDEVSSELKADSHRILSSQLIGRIVSLSHSFIPYKSLMGGKLAKKEYSAERGQLLITLVNSGIHESTLREIYKKSNFKHSYLFDMDLSNAYLYGIDLSGSTMRLANLHGADLSHSTLRNVNLIEANLDSVKLNYSTIHKTELHNAKLDNTDFTFANLDTVWVNKRVNINKSVFDKNFVCSTFFGNVVKDTVLIYCTKK